MKTRNANAAILALLLSATTWLPAATFDVSTLADSGTGSLRQAILDANDALGDDTITFSVTGTITLATNLPVITDNTVIIGPGTNLLTISGADKYGIFYMTSETNSLSDLTIAQGHALGINDFAHNIYFRTNASGVSSQGGLSMLRCVVRNCTNRYESLGVGIYSGGTLDMRDCAVIGCKHEYWDYIWVQGGGLYNDGTARITDCYFGNCSASIRGASGGGIYSTYGSLFVTNTVFNGCSAINNFSDGGAIVSRGETMINNCLITNCSGYWAGGLESYGNLTMINTRVVANSAVAAGGILVWGAGVISGCTISANNASYTPGGGGLLNAGYLEMYNCTVSQNFIAGSYHNDQAAAFSDQSPTSSNGIGITYLDHCTIVSNSGPYEIAAKGNFSTANTILADCQGVLNSGGYNLITRTNGADIGGDPTGNLYNVNPRLGPLQNNGGPTPTHALLGGSPAIDHADDGGVTTDQRGALRPSVPGTADIGAFEVVPPPNLQIFASGPTQVTLYWPSAPGPVVLQQNSGFVSNQWSDVSALPTDDGITVRLALPATDPKNFYRLRSR